MAKQIIWSPIAKEALKDLLISSQERDGNKDVYKRQVLWVKNYIGELNPDHDYYRNNATKNDGNIYLKVNYELVSGHIAYLDLQYSHINYKIHGLNDKYNWTAATPGMQKLDISEYLSLYKQ